MLYKDFVRINQIDAEISDMHERLARYYRERAKLTEGMAGTNSAAHAQTQPNNLSQATNASPRSLSAKSVSASNPDKATVTQRAESEFQTLKTIWQPILGSFPQYKTLKNRLEKAVTLKNQLTQKGLGFGLEIVAVPPQSQLAKIIRDGRGSVSNYRFIDKSLAPSSRGGFWNVLLVSTDIMPAEPVLVDDKQIDLDQFLIDKIDGRALGVSELIAADLQGLEVIHEGWWTLLLKNLHDTTKIPCATMQGDKIVFDVDDARCLVGENVIHLAVVTR